MDVIIFQVLLPLVCVVLLVELVRQRWRADRCRVLAKRRQAEGQTHSNDHHVAMRALALITDLARGEERTQILSLAIKVILVVLAVLWVVMLLDATGGSAP